MDQRIISQARRFERAQTLLAALRRELTPRCAVGEQHMDEVTDHLDALDRKVAAVLVALDAVYEKENA